MLGLSRRSAPHLPLAREHADHWLRPSIQTHKVSVFTLPG
jgi:hypothetical protein